MEGIKKTAYIVVFGALWGGMEMALGGFFHALHIPLRGMWMAGIGALMLCSSQLWIGGRATALYVAVIAAFLKLFSLGGLVISPAAAIIMEGIIASMVFSLGKGNLAISLAASVLITLYTIVHKFLSLAVVYRQEIAQIYDTFTGQGSVIVHLAGNSLLVFFLLYIILHIIVGLIMGGTAYYSVYKARKRLSD